MSANIRISIEEYELAKVAAKNEHRTINGQIEFWVKVGRCVLDNPDLPIDMIQELIIMDWKDNSKTIPFRFKQE
jgi:hypothetical protein